MEKIKKLKCKRCGKLVFNVGEKAIAVTCSECVMRDLNKKVKNENIRTI